MDLHAFTRRGALAAAIALAGLSAGCQGSDGDFQRLSEQTDSLREELASATRENEILTAALENINGEKERLARALQSAPAAAEAVALAGGEPAPAEGAPDLSEAVTKIYVAKRGDILFGIAARYNTTVQELLALNPYLMKRNGNMVWENDRIQLP